MLRDNYMLPKFYFINLEFSLNQFFPAFQLKWLCMLKTKVFSIVTANSAQFLHTSLMSLSVTLNMLFPATKKHSTYQVVRQTNESQEQTNNPYPTTIPLYINTFRKILKRRGTYVRNGT